MNKIDVISDNAVEAMTHDDIFLRCPSNCSKHQSSSLPEVGEQRHGETLPENSLCEVSIWLRQQQADDCG
jgi:hypothetical protein